MSLKQFMIKKKHVYILTKAKYTVLSAFKHLTGWWRSDGFTPALRAPTGKPTQQTSLDFELDSSILISNADTDNKSFYCYSFI